MKIDLRPIKSIRPYKKNPRLNDAAVEAVARAITEFGWRQPIVVDKAGVIIAGHTRYKAALQLKLKEVPVHVATDLSPAQVRAYRLADNQTAAIAEWDFDKLALELDALKAGGLDMSILGWSEEELAELMGPRGNKGLIDPDDVPEAPKVAITKRGDLWILGQHRLLCGDSTDAGDVDRVMDGKKAALVSTDPPYLVDYTGDRPNKGNKSAGKDWSATYREIDIKDADGFFRGLFTQVLRVIAPHSAIYCWHAHRRVGLIQAIWAELGILDHQEIVWVKPTTVFGRVYWHFRHEPCLMGWKQGSKPQHDGTFTHNSVWDDIGTIKPEEALRIMEAVKALFAESSVWNIDWEGKSRIVGNEHPTQKPVEIFARPMRKHTKRGNVCFEPFSGSGSQLIAAEMQGRRCYAIELEPVFVDVAVARWEKFTGKTAKLQRAGAGKTTSGRSVKGSNVRRSHEVAQTGNVHQ